MRQVREQMSYCIEADERFRQAIREGRVEDARLEVANGHDPNKATEIDFLAQQPELGGIVKPWLITLIHDEEVELISRLLEAGGDPNFISEGKLIPLVEAVSANSSRSLEVVDTLLSHGANPGIASRIEHWEEMPAPAACLAGNLEALKRLVRHGVDPNQPDGLGWTLAGTVLHGRSSSSRVIEFFEFLESEGVDLEERIPCNGLVVTHMVAEQDLPDVMQWLAERGIALEARDDRGETPGERALRFNQPGQKDVIDAQLAKQALGEVDPVLPAGGRPEGFAL